MKRLLLVLLLIPSFAKADIVPPAEASASDITTGTSHSKYISPAGLASAGVGATNGPSFITTTNIATTIALAVVSNLPLVELVHGTNHTYYSLIESAVSNSVYGDTINLKGIINAYTNIPFDCTINFIGATVTNNVNMNSAGPLFQPTGYGAILNGPGYIYPAADHATVYHAAFGSDARLGNLAFTNAVINNMTMYGDSDVIFIWQTNAYCSWTINGSLISSLTNAAWDIMVDSSSNNVGAATFNNDQFYVGPVVSSLGGATLRGVGTGGVLANFNACTFFADASIGANYAFNNSAVAATCLASNNFNNCILTSIGSHTTFSFNESLNGGDTLNNCFVTSTAGEGMRFFGSSTNIFNNVFIFAPTQVRLSAGTIVTNIGGNVIAATTTPANLIAAPYIKLLGLVTTNSPVVGNTNVLSTDGTNFYWRNDNALF